MFDNLLDGSSGNNTHVDDVRQSEPYISDISPEEESDDTGNIGLPAVSNRVDRSILALVNTKGIPG